MLDDFGGRGEPRQWAARTGGAAPIPLGVETHEAPQYSHADHVISDESVAGARQRRLWPGIQLYCPPIKHIPNKSRFETLDEGCRRVSAILASSSADTLLFDLEDGCAQKAQARAVLDHSLPSRRKRSDIQIAIRINPFGTKDFAEDMKLIGRLSKEIDVVTLAKSGEFHGAEEIHILSKLLPGQHITIQPIIEHPSSYRLASKLLAHERVHHAVFGIHDFSKAMGIRISDDNWLKELMPFVTELLVETRLAGCGLIGGVETYLTNSISGERSNACSLSAQSGSAAISGQEIIHRHALLEARLGMTGKQVIHPAHVSICQLAFFPSEVELEESRCILRAALAAGTVQGGAIRHRDKMLDPPMFGKALQSLLRSECLGRPHEEDQQLVSDYRNLLGKKEFRDIWPFKSWDSPETHNAHPAQETSPRNLALHAASPCDDPQGSHWNIVIATTSLQMLSAFALASTASVAPKIAASLGVPARWIGYQVALVYAFAAIISLLVTPIMRRCGAFRTSIIAAVGLSVGMAVTTMQTLESAIGGAICIGICYGLAGPSASHLLFMRAPFERRNLLFSIKQTGVPLGAGLAMAIIPLLTRSWDWQTSFLLSCIPCILLALFLIRIAASSPKEPKSPSLGTSSSLISSINILRESHEIRSLAIMSFFYSGFQFTLTSCIVTAFFSDLNWTLSTSSQLAFGVLFVGAVGRLMLGWLADHLIASRIIFASVGIINAALCVYLMSAEPQSNPVILLSVISSIGLISIGWSGVYMAEVARLSPNGMVGSATGGVLFFTFLGGLCMPALYSFVQPYLGSHLLSIASIGFLSLAGILPVASNWNGLGKPPPGKALQAGAR